MPAGVDRARARRLAAARRPASPAFPGRAGPRVAICMATYEPPGRPAAPPARLDPRADPRELGLRDQRRLLGGRGRSRALRGADGRRRPLRALAQPGAARLLPELRAGAVDGAGRRRLRDALRPGRPLAPRQARAAAGGSIGGAQLVYSDARIVSPDGERRSSSSYWTERRNNHTNFASLLLANSVTGAASLFRRELLDDALPFPPASRRAFHDHWLAVVAMARGEIAYVDEPLYDYVQHERRGDRALRGQPQAAADPAAPGRAAPQPDRRLARGLLLRLAPAAALRRGAAAALLGADDARPSAGR